MELKKLSRPFLKIWRVLARSGGVIRTRNSRLEENSESVNGEQEFVQFFR